MFDKSVYVSRRAALLGKMKDAGTDGIVLFLGNVDAPAQYKDNPYKWRQDSSWLYFFGIDDPGYSAVIDLGSGETTIYADDIDINDIIWMGPQPSVASKAAETGVAKSKPAGALDADVAAALSAGRRIHYLNPSRYYNIMKITSLTGESIKPSVPLTEAVISLRIVKEDIEIAAIDDACDLGYEMHSIGRDNIKPGILEQEIVGRMEGLTLSKGWGVSFPTILTQHGETLHNHWHDKIIEPGKLMIIDAGAENNEHYASDFTRTYPTTGRYSGRQKDIYEIVLSCNEFAFSMTRPGVSYREVHIATAAKMLEGLAALGIVKGDSRELAALGIAGLFQPHGLGHNMGLDVHDMEDLGENLVGYDRDQIRSPQLGLGNLRMARKLVPGMVITDEPGIYFIPALIEQWKREGRGKGIVNFSLLESYYDFGGIRIEDDVLVTADGSRRLGHRRLPVTVADIEAIISK